MNSAKKYFQIIVSFSFCAIVLLSSVTQTAYGANSTSNTTVTSKVDANGNVVRTTSIVIYTTKSIDQVKDTLVATSVINEHLLYDAMQAYRKEQKKKTTLKYSTKLSETAREYAKYLSDNKSFSHQDKQGNNGEVRLKKAGMSLSYWGELLAEATDAPQAFSALKGSVKHKEIMLKDDYTIVGVGYYKGKRVILFYYDKLGKFVDKVQPTIPKELKSTKSTTIDTKSTTKKTKKAKKTVMIPKLTYST